MTTLIANQLTKTKVTRKAVSYKAAKLIFPEIDEKLSELSNSNSGFSIRNVDDGMDIQIKDWVAYKLSGFNKDNIDFTYYWFH